MDAGASIGRGAAGGLLGARWTELRPRERVLAAAVLLVVAVAAAGALVRAPAALGSLHDWADRNRALSPQDREIGARYLDISPPFLYAARAHIPEDGRFAVLTGGGVAVATPLTLSALSDFATYFLLPRRRVEPHEADWILCYGCEPPPRTTPIWEGADGSILRVAR